MKAILAMLYEPRVHMLILGLLIACTQVGFRAEDTIEAAAEPLASRSCKDADLPHHPPTPLLAVADDLSEIGQEFDSDRSVSR